MIATRRPSVDVPKDKVEGEISDVMNFSNLIITFLSLLQEVYPINKHFIYLTALYQYPIKSLGAISTDRATVNPFWG